MSAPPRNLLGIDPEEFYGVRLKFRGTTLGGQIKWITILINTLGNASLPEVIDYAATLAFSGGKESWIPPSDQLAVLEEPVISFSIIGFDNPTGIAF
jgi:hypothetical protein